MRWQAAVITVSDSRAGGKTADGPSGDLIVSRLAELPADVTDRRLVPDEVEAIRAALRAVLAQVQLVVLSGGTGLGPRDVTPQAISPLLDYEIPGMTETMRREGLRSTPHAMLSRQVVGVSRGRLVIALPGSPRAVDQGLKAVWRALPHALRLLAGDTAPGEHHPPM
jgi:molybdenum cofactor synthesis domain-containing protein